MDKQRCLQATSTPAITTGVNVATGVVVQDDGLNIKEEWADTDMDVGPTVLQPMDATYIPVQPDVSIIKQESRIKDNKMNAVLCGGVKEEIIEDERRADTDDQRSDKESQSKQRARSQLCCDKCVKTYASKASLMEHFRNLHSVESHKCHKCNKKFPSKNYLYNHTRYAHSEQQYDCAVCKKICKSKRALSLHVYQVHRPRPAVSSPVVYTCDYCHKTYASKQVLVQHIDVVHTKALYRCSECKKEYKGKHLLQGHIKRVHSKEKHEGSKPTCDYCKKMFNNKGTIRGHIARLHSSGSYKCHPCNKIFKCKEYLMSHNTYVHPAGSHQLHTCTNCGRNFKSKWHCRRHEKRGVECTRPTAGNTSAVASTSRQQHNVVIVKEEPADGELDLGPVVFQHMDCNYRPYKLEPGLD